MSKRVRITEDYSEQNMAGIEAIIIKDERLGSGSALLGFPLDSPLVGMTVSILPSIVAGGFLRDT